MTAHGGSSSEAGAKSGSTSLAARVRLVALMVGLSVMFWRCTHGNDPMPYWSGDAFEVAAPAVSIGPTLSIVLSIVTILCGMALTVLSAGIDGFSRAAVFGVLAFLVVGLSGISKDAHPDHARIWLDWAAALALALGVRDASTTDTTNRVLRLSLAMLGACVAASLVKGASQYLFEHPQTMQSFARDKEAFFRSQGWTPDSPMARAFVRRISQRESSGWFGLANVFTTLVACGCVMCAALSMLVREKRTHLVLMLLAIACAVGVYLGGSKAGFAIVAIGIVCAVLPRFVRSPRVGVVALLAVVALVWGGLLVRGLVGERLGERSLLFRAQYHVTALRATFLAGTKHTPEAELLAAAQRLGADASPVRVAGLVARGTGPASFKEAGLLLKPRTSPEDVSSAHSLPMDLLASLGFVGGLAVCAWGSLALGAARALRPDASVARDTIDSGTGRDPLWLLPVLGVLVPIMLASLIESEIATLDTRGVRLLAGLVGAGVALWLFHALRTVDRAALGRALSAASIACVAHLLIELTGVTPGANAWCGVLLACAAGCGSVPTAQPTNVLRALKDEAIFSRVTGAVAVVGVFAVAAFFVSHLQSVYSWERSLARAYASAEPVQQFTMRARALASGEPFDADTPESIARDLSATLGVPVRADAQSVRAAIDALRLRQLPDVIRDLRTANSLQPAHRPTAEALSKVRTMLAQAHALAGNGEAAQKERVAAVACVTEAIRLNPTAAAWSWLGQLEAAHAEIFADPQAVQRSQKALARASLLSPYEGMHPRHLAESLAASNPSEAAWWARRALVVDGWNRLDPLKQLTEAQRQRLQALANAATLP